MNTNANCARLFAALVAIATFSAAAAPPPGQIAGVTATGERGVRQSVEEIMARQRRAETTHGRRPTPLMPEREVEHLRERAQNPEAREDPFTALGRSVVPSFRDESQPYTPQVVGTSFLGATVADTGAFPPDTMGAVGPTQFFVFVNGRLRTFDKSTGLADGVINANPDVFFASVMTPVPLSGVNFTSDPQVRYDRLTGRWFLAIIDVPSSTTVTIGDTPNRLLLAVSDGAGNGTISNSTVWTFYFVQQNTIGGGNTGDFLDYESLGVDANALYVGGDMFVASTGAFHQTDGFVIRKSSVLNGGPIVVTAFRALAAGSGEGPFAPRGVDNFDPAATEGYFIGVSNAAFSRLVLRRVSDPGGTPTISSNILLTVSTTVFPEPVPHLGNTGGTNGRLDALDDRLYAAHVRNGRLWTAHNIEVGTTGVASGSGGRDGVRWYELQGLTGTPSVVQSGTIFDAAASNPKYFWIPSVMVSGQGHAAFGFSSAGVADHINAVTVGRLASDAAGTTETAVTYTASSTAYNPTSDPGSASGRRWGDYSFTSLDPTDDMTMWTIQEFCNAGNSYGVQIVKLGAPPPATPSSAAPASVTAGQSSVQVTITGTSQSGAAFFDTPATGILPAPNHITASVTGGITVNSVSFTDATHVTLDLDTSAASPGAQDVTITNPDGQTASGVGILTVEGQSADLSLLKADSPDPVVAGTTLTYTLNLTNNGTGSAAGVSLSDPLPSTTTFLSLTAPAGWTSSSPAVGAGGTVTFSNPLLAAAAAPSFTVAVRVKPGIASGTLVVNTAAVSATTSDPAPGNNSASSSTTVTTRADVQIGVSDSPDPVVAGSDVTYTLPFKNNGPSDAKSVSVSDALPAGMTFVGASSPTGWTVTAPAVGANGTVSFTKPTVGPGGTATFTITAKVDPATVDGTTLSNTVSASSLTTDPSAANNSATTTTKVKNPPVDLSITKTGASVVSAGARLAYTVKVTNLNATSPAQTLTLTDAVPSSTIFDSNSGAAGWSCVNPPVGAKGTISCTADSLAASTTSTFTIVMKVAAGVAEGSIIKNVASVAAGSPDPNSANNTAQATTTTNRRANLAVSIEASPDPVAAGQNLTYTVVVTNLGPSNAYDMTLSETLGSQAGFVSNSGATGWTCANPAPGASGTINCSGTAMAPATSKIFTIIARPVDTPASGTYSLGNSASVGSSVTDQSTSNNDATISTVVNDP